MGERLLRQRQVALPARAREPLGRREAARRQHRARDHARLRERRRPTCSSSPTPASATVACGPPPAPSARGPAEACASPSLRVLFEAAGLPGQYAPAQFVIWLKQQGIYDEVVAGVESRGKSFARELTNLYVAQALPEALLAVRPDFAPDGAAVRGLLKEQFPNRSRHRRRRAGRRHARRPRAAVERRRTPAAHADRPRRAAAVHRRRQPEDPRCRRARAGGLAGVREQGAARRGGPVGDGRHAGAAEAQGPLHGLRAALRHRRGDRHPRRRAAQEAGQGRPTSLRCSTAASGEIGRHLGGSKLAATGADGEFLQADYPMLPTRRRFWEHVLRALDRGGTQGQLRTQLRMAQEAAKSVGNLPLGHVVGADFIYDQQSSGMLQSGVLPKDTNEDILRLRKEGPAGELQSRIAAVVFMIDRLREVNAELGVVADATTVGDLLVVDLTAPSAGFRNRGRAKPSRAMADAGLLAATDGTYSLVNEETQQWLGRLQSCSRRHRGRCRAGRCGTRRGGACRRERGARRALRSPRARARRRVASRSTSALSRQQPRARLCRSGCAPNGTSPRSRRAKKPNGLGNESPVVNVLLPKTDAEALRTQLVRLLAARETVESARCPQLKRASMARKTIESERDAARCEGARDHRSRPCRRQGVPAGRHRRGRRQSQGRRAGRSEKALIRLFPRFGEADHASWAIVSKRVLDGSGDALGAVGYQGEPEKHPVCAEILAFVEASGTKGTDVRQKYEGVGFGWPQDAVDAALFSFCSRLGYCWRS